MLVDDTGIDRHEPPSVVEVRLWLRCPRATVCRVFRKQDLFDLQFYNQMSGKIGSDCGRVRFGKGHLTFTPYIVRHVYPHTVSVKHSPREIQTAAFP